jgi:peptidoglycan-associated lipoprotein
MVTDQALKQENPVKKPLFSAVGIVLMAVLLTGCSSTPKEEGAEVTTAGGGAYGSGATGYGSASGSSSQGYGGSSAGAAAELNNPNSPLYTRVIYFDFDSNQIREEYKESLRAHAKYLSGNPSVRLTLEGHADERGTREYNLALGENRGEQVKRFMQAEGANGSQISVISYGEEKPADAGHADASWAYNRRAVLVY